MLSKKEQKFIKSLKVKKYRAREERFLVEGTKNVLETLNSDYSTDLIVGTSEFLIANESQLKNIRTEEVNTAILTQLSTFKTNESVIAVAQMRPPKEFSTQLTDHLFVLDGVGDPGNLGTIIRTLDWFGFKELVCSPNCAEFYHPKVIASSMGSYTRMNVNTMDLEVLISSVSNPVYTAEMDGRSLNEIEFNEPSIIVMGSESHGISNEVSKLINNHLTIPKLGQAESLNVGIATGIIAGYLRMP